MARRRMLRLAGIAALVLAFLSAPRDAYAYLDPGTGSLILQFVIAGLVGSAFAIKLFWRRIVGLFRKRRSEPDRE
ncbi:MAG TPA: hypothetical protein VNE39_03335 [Planctomycetota bacterium]|nr:hypothetical protein [Planctomycetota bacterium]